MRWWGSGLGGWRRWISELMGWGGSEVAMVMVGRGVVIVVVIVVVVRL